MSITELMEALESIQREHGDVEVYGTVPWGNPEMTVHGISFTEAGPLTPQSNEANRDLPERVVIEWKFIS